MTCASRVLLSSAQHFQPAAGQRRGHVGAAAAGALEQSERFRNASSLAGRPSTQEMGPQTALTITLASSFRTAL